MPRGLFQMGTLGWTPAAELATKNQSGAASSYAAMDKAVNQTQTTKTSSGGNIFGDILPIVGAGIGAAFGGPAGMAIGSGLGGAVGTAAGGQSAASLGGLGVAGSSILGKDLGLAATKMKDGKEVFDPWNWR